MFETWLSGLGQTGNKENLPLVLHEPDTELAFQVPHLYDCSSSAAWRMKLAWHWVEFVCRHLSWMQARRMWSQCLAFQTMKPLEIWFCKSLANVGTYLDTIRTSNAIGCTYSMGWDDTCLVLHNLSQLSRILHMYNMTPTTAWCAQTKYEAQRALLKNGLVLSASVMIGVQPLASQFRPLFDSTSEDLSMSVPPSSLKEQELSSKVSLLLVDLGHKSLPRLQAAKLALLRCA